MQLLQTGRGMLDGADLLRAAPDQYSSSVEYNADNPIAQSLKGVAQVMSAGLGTRIYYTQHGSFDTHTNELVNHAKLWMKCRRRSSASGPTLSSRDRADNTVIWMFSEFGRRIEDNGAGTDHGSGGAAFVIGNPVNADCTANTPAWTRRTTRG